MSKLTPKQQEFVRHYLDNGFNATLAANDAGYKGNRKTLAVVGFENLRKPNVRLALQEGMINAAMDGPEVIARLRTLGVGVDILEFYEYKEITVTHTNRKNETWSHVIRILEPNIDLIREKGYGHMIQKITMSGHQTVITWKDQVRALEILARINDLMTPMEGTDNSRPILILEADERN